jgi:hypothetical protein
MSRRSVRRVKSEKFFVGSAMRWFSWILGKSCESLIMEFGENGDKSCGWWNLNYKRPLKNAFEASKLSSIFPESLAAPARLELKFKSSSELFHSS